MVCHCGQGQLVSTDLIPNWPVEPRRYRLRVVILPNPRSEAAREKPALVQPAVCLTERKGEEDIGSMRSGAKALYYPPAIHECLKRADSAAGKLILLKDRNP